MTMADATFEDGAERVLMVRAEVAGDVPVMSALVQDSVLPVTEMRWDRKARKLALLLNRFRWEGAGKRGPYERVRAALSVETVRAVKSRRLRLGARDAVGAILDITFRGTGDPPAGTVSLRLGGGGEITLEGATHDGCSVFSRSAPEVPICW